MYIIQGCWILAGSLVNNLALLQNQVDNKPWSMLGMSGKI